MARRSAGETKRASVITFPIVQAATREATSVADRDDLITARSSALVKYARLQCCRPRHARVIEMLVDYALDGYEDDAV